MVRRGVVLFEPGAEVAQLGAAGGPQRRADLLARPGRADGAQDVGVLRRARGRIPLLEPGRIEDDRAVDPLSDLRRIQVDEGGRRAAAVGQGEGERLPPSAGAPDHEGPVGREVVEPQREVLIDAITHRLQEATAKAYSSYQSDFRAYLEEVIAEAVDRNREINTISQIPGVGSTISQLLENAISDIVFNVVNRMMEDVASLDNDEVIAQITSISTDALLTPEYDRRLNRLSKSIVMQTLDVIKEHVQIQQWKIDEAPSARDRKLAKEMGA